MKKSSIGFVCPSKSWGGLEINVVRIGLWLKQRGRTVIIYTLAGSVMQEKAIESGLPTRVIDSSFKLGDLIAACRLARMGVEDKVEVMVVHLNRNILLGVMAKLWGRGAFALAYMQHMHVGMKKRDLFHTWMYRRLDSWIAPLKVLADDVYRLTNMPRARVDIAPFGIELERFQTNRLTKEDARRKLQLPADATIAGVVGRLDPKKGQHVLIEACSRLHLKGENLHLLIVGDPNAGFLDYENELRQLIAEKNLAEFVHLRPYSSEVEQAFAALDYFTMTSQSETYGMVTIEAMASRLPVIATNTGGTPGIIDHEKNGLLVPPDDPETLAEALMSLIHDPAKAERLAIQAETDALHKYAHNIYCDRLEQLFDRLSSTTN